MICYYVGGGVSTLPRQIEDKQFGDKAWGEGLARAERIAKERGGDLVIWSYEDADWLAKANEAELKGPRAFHVRDMRGRVRWPDEG